MHPTPRFDRCPENNGERMTDALHVRLAGGEPKPEVRQFMEMPLKGMARDSLTRAGISTKGMSADEVLTRAGEHTTSDVALVVSKRDGQDRHGLLSGRSVAPETAWPSTVAVQFQDRYGYPAGGDGPSRRTRRER